MCENNLVLTSQIFRRQRKYNVYGLIRFICWFVSLVLVCVNWLVNGRVNFTHQSFLSRHTFYTCSGVVFLIWFVCFFCFLGFWMVLWVGNISFWVAIWFFWMVISFFLGWLFGFFLGGYLVSFWVAIWFLFGWLFGFFLGEYLVSCWVDIWFLSGWLFGFFLGGYLVSTCAVIWFCLFYGLAMSGEKEDMDALCFLIESVPTPLMNSATKLVSFSSP